MSNFEELMLSHYYKYDLAHTYFILRGGKLDAHNLMVYNNSEEAEYFVF
jgi:hypothetical protein